MWEILLYGITPSREGYGWSVARRKPSFCVWPGPPTFIELWIRGAVLCQVFVTGSSLRQALRGVLDRVSYDDLKVQFLERGSTRADFLQRHCVVSDWS
jgi:hypothetical protein